MTKKEFEFIEFQGGDGSSIHNAIKIVGTNNFISGIEAEFDFIQTVFKENEIESADPYFIIFPDIIIHRFNIVTKKGEVKDIFFNASNFHTKNETEFGMIFNYCSAAN